MASDHSNQHELDRTPRLKSVTIRPPTGNLFFRLKQ